MLQELLNRFHHMGIIPLFLIMAIEGCSIPFPGIMAVITYGYLLSPQINEILGLAIGMSLTYSVFSFIPYWLGFKFQKKMQHRFERKMKRAQHWFHKYGEWSIVLTRLLGIGYISYVAGMSAVKVWKYGLFTFVGVCFWSFALLFLGQIYKGDPKVVIELFQMYQSYIYISMGFIILILVLVQFRRHKIHQKGRS